MKFTKSFFVLCVASCASLSFASVSLETMEDLNSFYQTDNLNPMTNFTASTVKSKQDLNKIFYSLSNTNKWTAKPNTQCFNRAHYWAKYMKDYFAVDSMKVHILYTSKYTRSISSKWWFHVAPMLNVNNELYVLDNTFLKRPVTLANWEKRFTRKMYRGGDLKNYRCRVIENLSEFYETENQDNEYCNILVSSMYYWEPSELTTMEESETIRDEFNPGELKTAVANIFWVWSGYFNALKF